MFIKIICAKCAYNAQIATVVLRCWDADPDALWPLMMMRIIDFEHLQTTNYIRMKGATDGKKPINIIIGALHCCLHRPFSFSP